MMYDIDFKEGDELEGNLFKLASKAGIIEGETDTEKKKNFKKIVKDFETVEEEATIGPRGYYTHGKKLRDIVKAGGELAKKSATKQIKVMKNYSKTQKEYLRKAEQLIEEMQTKVNDYNADEKGIGKNAIKESIVALGRRYDPKFSGTAINKNGDSFIVNVKESVDGKLELNLDGINRILDRKRSNIKGIANELNSSAKGLEELGVDTDRIGIGTKSTASSETAPKELTPALDKGIKRIKALEVKIKRREGILAI